MIHWPRASAGRTFAMRNISTVFISAAATCGKDVSTPVRWMNGTSGGN